MTAGVDAFARCKQPASGQSHRVPGYVTLTTRRLRPRHCAATIDDCPTHHWADSHERQSHARYRSSDRFCNVLYCWARDRGKVDGNWSMVAETTRGHCGIIDVGLVISRGRIYSTSGSYAFNPIRLGGRVASSGYVRLNAVTGPRTAHGTGRLHNVSGSGTWSGVGPSGRATGSGTPIAINAGASLPRKCALRAPSSGDLSKPKVLR